MHYLFIFNDPVTSDTSGKRVQSGACRSQLSRLSGFSRRKASEVSVGCGETGDGGGGNSVGFMFELLRHSLSLRQSEISFASGENVKSHGCHVCQSDLAASRWRYLNMMTRHV